MHRVSLRGIVVAAALAVAWVASHPAVTAPILGARNLDQLESSLRALEIPYRLLRLCSGDTSFASRITYDIEAHAPFSEPGQLLCAARAGEGRSGGEGQGHPEPHPAQGAHDRADHGQQRDLPTSHRLQEPLVVEPFR